MKGKVQALGGTFRKLKIMAVLKLKENTIYKDIDICRKLDINLEEFQKFLGMH